MGKSAVIFLFLILFTTHSFATNQCHSIFDRTAFWSDSSIAEKRIQAVLKHQNLMRQNAEIQISKVRGEAIDLPQLKLKFEKDDLAAPLRIDSSEQVKYWIEQGYPEQSSSGQFFIADNLMIRASYNDFWGLNYVYRFEGARLIEVTPFAKWHLEQTPAETVTLYRSMNASELLLWKSAEISKLGARSWGFGEAQGETQSAVHFSLKPWNGKHQVQIQIPKKVLLEIAEKNPVQVWAGALTENAKTLSEVENFEFVLSQAVLVDLQSKKLMSIEFKD
jgi:hypothetical protein